MYNLLYITATDAVSAVRTFDQSHPLTGHPWRSWALGSTTRLAGDVAASIVSTPDQPDAWIAAGGAHPRGGASNLPEALFAFVVEPLVWDELVVPPWPPPEPFDAPWVPDSPQAAANNRAPTPQAASAWPTAEPYTSESLPHHSFASFARLVVRPNDRQLSTMFTLSFRQRRNRSSLAIHCSVVLRLVSAVGLTM